MLLGTIGAGLSWNLLSSKSYAGERAAAMSRG